MISIYLSKFNHFGTYKAKVISLLTNSLRRCWQLQQTLQFVWQHPLNRHHKLKSIFRFLQWQISSKLAFGPVIIDYIQGSKLIAKKGWCGITGNIYVGLYDFEEMSFLLHMLTADDYFIDIGANLGIYTILAGAVRNARCLAIEPVPESFKWLQQHISINGIEERVKLLNIGVGSLDSNVEFLSDADTLNYVIPAGIAVDPNRKTITAPIKPLDTILAGECPTLIKVDIEGFEGEMIKGAHLTLNQKNLLAVIMELGWGGGKRYGIDDNQVHEKMLVYGFNPFTYSPEQRVLTPLKKHNRHGNTIYLRQAKLQEITARLKSAPAIEVLNNVY